MSALSFQEIIFRLDQFWAARGCVVAEPYDVEVGAGTMAPATFLRVLGPEPWKVAYPQPSRRPADGRYAENPNRYQHYFQYQVIVKPPPPDPLRLYLESIEALGLSEREHDIRFVEDNWENPSLGAWGLGWEVWLDGLEITQFTYFQQCGSLDLDPPSVEITYGLERIAMYLQGVRDMADIRWNEEVTYGELYRESEIEHCTYDFETADVDTLRTLFDLYEREAARVIAGGLIAPAHELVLKCSHLFNLLDSRGAIGVAQRASYLGRMRPLARKVAVAYLEQRERLGHPLLGRWADQCVPPSQGEVSPLSTSEGPTPFLLEVGVEELPAGDLSTALEQLRAAIPRGAAELDLELGETSVCGTPRRLVVRIDRVGVAATEGEELVRGPPVSVAYDADGRPTRAAEGFARTHGVATDALERLEIGGREYVCVRKRVVTRPLEHLLADLSSSLLGGLRFRRPMYWQEPGVQFSRPVRWIVALLDESIVPVEFAGVRAGRSTLPPRGCEQERIEIASAGEYVERMEALGVMVDVDRRREAILVRSRQLAEETGGVLDEDAALVEEVTNLVERPDPILGSFDAEYLQAPSEALITVMKMHQRYFPIRAADGSLLPRFVAVANGERDRPELVRQGYEDVLRARFADAVFFYRQDLSRPLGEFVSDLAQVTFLEGLGSMLDKTERLRHLAPEVARELGVGAAPERLDRAAQLAKADLATALVRELTELQGAMGRAYALTSGEHREVAEAIFEHYLPRVPGDRFPAGDLGFVLGVADRMDTLVAGFAAGLEPTGSSDPYGLRRVALGLIQVLMERGTRISLRDLAALTAPRSPVAIEPERLDALLAFVTQRLRIVLQDRGHRAEAVEAVLASIADRPSEAARTVAALDRSLETGAFQRLMAGIKRADRIVPRDGELELRTEDLREPADRELLAAYERANALARALEPDQVDELVGALLPLAEPIDRFFEAVLVMTEDSAVRTARLALLRRIRDLPGRSFEVSLLPAPTAQR